MQDNLYNFVAPPPRAPSPIRIFKNNARLQEIQRQNDLLKFDHRTMGLAEITPPQPNEFLRKNARSLYPRFFQSDQKYCGARMCLEHERRPPVANHFYQDTEKRERNFHLENLNRAGEWMPFKRTERIVDAKRGHVVDLNKTVLRPVYLGSKGYGKVPRCVQMFLDKAAHQKKESEAQKSADEEHRIQELLDNKNTLEAELKRVKDEWDEKNKEFLLLPTITDTLNKMTKRHKLEKQLTLLEDTISSIQRQYLQAAQAFAMATSA